MSTHESMTPLSPERLAEIRERVEKRTPGVWEAEGHEVTALAPEWCDVVSTEVNCMSYCYGGTGRGVERAEDADLIAHAPQDLTDLLAEVQRLRARTTVDNDMTERAARAMLWGEEAITSDHGEWDRLPERTRKHYRADARYILDAALGTQEEA